MHFQARERRYRGFIVTPVAAGIRPHRQECCRCRLKRVTLALVHYTVFDTPLVNTLLRLASLAYFRLAGWRIEGELPASAHKCVLIAAPHTSNWDLPYTLMVAFALHLNVYWMGKASIFKPPFGGVMRWLGGIAVQREQSNNLVAASVAALKAADGPLQLIVPPEGTRRRTRQWKTGFYYIAVGAELPILLAYMDYARKRAGLGPVFQPSGDLGSDMAAIKAYYAPLKGRHAQQFDAD
jgi:1-acyl-sn-glycerol-3-phosphate acyltransferase